MRKLTFLIFLVSILNISTQKSMNQGRLTYKSPLEQLQKSHLGKAVVKMIELQRTLQSQQAYDKLFSALDLLKTQLIQSKEQENLNFNEDGEAHNYQLEIINNQINIYSEQAISINNILTVLEQDAQQLSDDLVFSEQQLELSRSGKSQEENYLVTLDQQHTQDISDYQNVLQLLSECISKLREASTSTSQAFSSFVQTNQQYFSKFSEELSEKLKQVNKEIFLKPITNFFIQISSEERTMDLSAISRAIEALQGLQELYQNGLVRIENDFNVMYQEHTNLLNNFDAQITSLRDEVLPRTQLDIETNQQNQENRRLELTDCLNNQAQAQQNLQAENESWAQRLEQHQILIPQFDQEYHVVVQAERVIAAEQPQQ